MIFIYSIKLFVENIKSSSTWEVDEMLHCERKASYKHLGTFLKTSSVSLFHIVKPQLFNISLYINSNLMLNNFILLWIDKSIKFESLNLDPTLKPTIYCEFQHQF